MIVESYGVSFPDYPGGIQKLDSNESGFISQVCSILLFLR